MTFQLNYKLQFVDRRLRANDRHEIKRRFTLRRQLWKIKTVSSLRLTVFSLSGNSSIGRDLLKRCCPPDVIFITVESMCIVQLNTCYVDLISDFC